jgi:hypothetical protein
MGNCGFLLEKVQTAMMKRIRCTFQPEVELLSHIVSVDSPFPAVWEMEVDQLPEPHSLESDQLREHPNAPEWVREWSGPFEVNYEVL